MHADKVVSQTEQPSAGLFIQDSIAGDLLFRYHQLLKWLSIKKSDDLSDVCICTYAESAYLLASYLFRRRESLILKDFLLHFSSWEGHFHLGRSSTAWGIVAPIPELG